MEKKVLSPAIVLSTNTMGLGVIRALGSMGVPIIAMYYDKGDTGYLSKYVQERVYVPHPEKSEDAFIECLVEYADHYSGGMLIPTSDATLATVSRHKMLLEQYYLVASPEWEISQLFIDKQRTYALADAIGVLAPKTRVPHSIEDVERYGQMIQYPCLVKPSQSHQYYDQFKTKMVRADNFDQMLAAYQQAAEVGIEVMLQELIPGDDSQGANYNCYFWDGAPLVEFTAKKIRSGPPEIGSPRVAMSSHIPEVIEPGRKILEAMGFHGYACTEFKQDPRDGVYKLIEVNGRHNLSTLLAVHCGINFPWLHYRHLVQGELPSAPDQETGMYWIDMTRDVGYSLKSRSREKYSLGQYLRPYLSTHTFAIFDWKDPKPFVKRCLDLAKTAYQTLMSALRHQEKAMSDDLSTSQRSSTAPFEVGQIPSEPRAAGPRQ
jgi:predicted ATP-grasp superfamily ATP-dependent carboligase